MAENTPAIIYYRLLWSASLLRFAPSFNIQTDLDMEKATRFIAKSRAWEKGYREKNSDLLSQADTVRETLGKLKKTTDIIRQKVAEYHLAQAEAARQREAEAIARATETVQDAALDQAATLEAKGDKEGSQAILERSLSVKPLVPVGQGVHTPDNTHFRQDWYFDIRDSRHLPAEFLTPDQSKLDKLAKAMREQTSSIIPETAGTAKFRTVPVVRTK